jgi:hypothetical protein
MKHTLLSLCLLSSSLFSQDTSLHEYLIDGEPWKEAGQRLCLHRRPLLQMRRGTLFFTDVKAG